MPLDPFFAERLRVHRRYLYGKSVADLKRRAGWPWLSLPARGGDVTVAAPTPAGSTAAAEPASPGPASGSAPSEATTSGTAKRPAASKAPGSAAKGQATSKAPAKGAKRPAAAKASAKTPMTRERKRRAALAWDRKELKEVGTQGPRLRTVEHTVPVEGYPDVRVRVYYPDVTTGRGRGDDTPHRSGAGAAPAHSDGAATPAVPACVSFFGGAFRIGGIDYPTTDAAHRRRTHASGVAMVAVDYALAPEHRYPTQVEQGYAALVWVFEHAAQLGLDPERIGILGTSAGGCIAAAVTLVNRDRARLPIRLQVLEVPVTDLTGRHVDMRVPWSIGIPSPFAWAEMRSIARTYIPHPAVAREPYASPLLAESHAGLPPAVILTAEYDPLRGDGAAYAAALRESGAEASAVRYLGVTHDVPMFTGVLDAARRWEADIVSALRRLHG